MTCLSIPLSPSSCVAVPGSYLDVEGVELEQVVVKRPGWGPGPYFDRDGRHAG